MKKLQGFLLTVSAIFICSAAFAELDVPPEGPPTGEIKLYFVSSVLNKKDETTVIKLVHSVQRSISAQMAAAQFESAIRKEFPDYTIATTLVSASSDTWFPDQKSCTKTASFQGGESI